MDNYLYFDVDRINNLGQTPIYLTVQNRNPDMLKFLLKSGCNITLKDYRGETIKDTVYRYC